MLDRGLAGWLVFPTKVVTPYVIGAVNRPCGIGIDAGACLGTGQSDR